MADEPDEAEVIQGETDLAPIVFVPAFELEWICWPFEIDFEPE